MNEKCDVTAAVCLNLESQVTFTGKEKCKKDSEENQQNKCERNLPNMSSLLCKRSKYTQRKNWRIYAS